jgi:hypothetical protein
LDRALIHSSGTPKRNSKCFLRELLSLSPWFDLFSCIWGLFLLR